MKKPAQVKAAFFDIDGTLLSHTLGQVTPSSRAALAELRRRGISIFAATGRHCTELAQLPLDDLDFDGYVTLNGQYCYDAQGRVLAQYPMEPEAEASLLALFQARTLPLMLVEGRRMYINYIDGQVAAVQKAISTPLPQVGQWISGAPLFQAIAYGPPDLLNEQLCGIPRCTMTYWHSQAVDLLPAGGGKCRGIAAVLARYGLTPADAIAFGDGENDQDMLTGVGLGVAMGNAPASVRASAGYVTKSVDEDGVSYALQQFGLI
ncbi:MAG: Cof-type HAD-IIB family hydrolase [Candidatus Onthomonas sp.]